MKNLIGTADFFRSILEALRMGLSMNDIIDPETLRLFLSLLIETVRVALPLLRGWATVGRRTKKGGARRKA